MIRRFTQLVLVAILAVSSAAMAAETVELPSEVTIFKNVNVFNGTDNKLIKGCNVVVENNLIQNTCAKNVAPAKGATVIDGKGMTLMPGLIDSHVHLNLTGLFQTLNGAEYSNWDEIGAMAAANARDYLMDGYTTVRDTCGLGTGLK